MINQKGQTLLEILLAFSVSILVLGAVIFSITTSLNSTQYTRNQNLATFYAQEGMAVVRKRRDSDPSAFFTDNSKYCLGPSMSLTAPEATNPCGGATLLVGEIFTREIEFKQKSTDCCSSNNSVDCSGPTPTATAGSKVIVKVSWTDNKCPIGTPYCHKVELITCFSSIDLKPTP